MKFLRSTEERTRRDRITNKILSRGRLPLWSSGQFLATDPEVLGSIPGASRFSLKQWVWNGVHSAS
jgi:hypothetical protein